MPCGLLPALLSGRLTISPAVWQWIGDSRQVSGAFHAAFLRALACPAVLDRLELTLSRTASPGHSWNSLRLEPGCAAGDLLLICVLHGWAPHPQREDWGPEVAEAGRLMVWPLAESAQALLLGTRRLVYPPGF